METGLDFNFSGQTDETIVAVASGNMISGVAVIRISGTLALDIAKRLSKRADFPNRVACFSVVDTGSITDEVIIIYFKAPHSFTGEDVVEIHCHGSPLIVSLIIQSAIKMGARQAEGGEFTKRAFLNGKMNLISAEAVNDIIRAQTRLQLAEAQRLSCGQLFKTLNSIQADILDLVAELNVAIDYPEEDLDAKTISTLLPKIKELEGALTELAATFERGRLIRDGIRVAIYGQPNVGKSSLLNCLVGKNRAIVSPIEGTTRDTVEDCYEYKGLLFRVTDSAGIRENADDIEREGIRRAQEAAEESDVLLVVFDKKDCLVSVPFNKPTIYIRNKIDLLGENGEDKAIDFVKTDGDFSLKAVKNRNSMTEGLVELGVSALFGTNIEDIKELIYQMTAQGLGDGLMLTNARHYDAVLAAARSLACAARLSEADGVEIICIDLMDAANELGKITGILGSEEVVNRIFSKFCVGK